MNNSWFSAIVLFFLIIFLSFFPGHLSAASVALESIQIYRTHDWLRKPTIYFLCQGENKTVLPDVKKANIIYTFKGEESWQPLTEFSIKKCKRCGFFEEDILTHDTFDEWELCPSDFTSHDGRYTHVKKGEFNATFICSACADVVAGHDAPPSNSNGRGISEAVVILISAVVTAVVIFLVIGGYRYWQRKRRQQEQARFMKLFEEQDDIEDELGLRDVL